MCSLEEKVILEYPKNIISPSVQDDGLPHSSSPTDAPRSDSEANQSCVLIGDGNRLNADPNNAKKKKTRRGKSKRKQNKPYGKGPWQQRRNSDKDSNRIKFVRAKIQAMGHTLVPCNTNQFLMEDHMLHPAAPQPRIPSARTRDSSFSVDSEENYFMSLPEDEEDFLTKEFSSVYEDAQCERLNAMSKNDLIQEYMIMESRLDHYARSARNQPAMDRGVVTASDRVKEPVESASVTIMTSIRKIKELEKRIQELVNENNDLRRERDYLAKNQQQTISSSSSDSESDSSMESLSTISSSDSSMDEPVVLQQNGTSHHENSSDSHTKHNGLLGNHIDYEDIEIETVKE